MNSHARIVDPWGAATPVPRGAEWPPRQDSQLQEGVHESDVERWTQTASLLHSDGDAMDIGTIDGRIVGVRGRVQDRVNRGRLGPKDLFGWQANASGDRLRTPLIGGRPSSWDEAMSVVTDRCRSLLQDVGPSAVGF
jgi:predicted molibdopterin-dependent oxidoreductase YjgC